MDRTGQRIAGDAALSAPGKSVFRAGLLCRSARLFRADPDPCLPHPLSGRLRSGRQRPDGHFPHGIRRLLHRRGSVRAGKHPQRRNDLSPLSALLWQNHRCFTPPKSRKSFFLAAKSPSASITETEGLCLLYLCLSSIKPSRNHLRGFLIAAWAGAKITGRSESHISTYIRFYSYVSPYVVVSFQPHCYSIKTRIHRSLIYIALIKHIPNVPFNRLV